MRGLHAIIAFSGALAGTPISYFVAKTFIARSLRDLETALEICKKIEIKLAAIDVKLEVLEPMQMMVQEHEKKLYAMRAKHARTSSRSPNGGD